jgi:hypothetical protein
MMRLPNLSPRAWAGLGLGLSTLAAGVGLGQTEGVSPFLHLSQCLAGQAVPSQGLLLGHCPACWVALGFLALMIALPGKNPAAARLAA